MLNFIFITRTKPVGRIKAKTYPRPLNLVFWLVRKSCYIMYVYNM